MLNPDDFLPAGVHEGYRKNLTELFCGKAGVEKIDSMSMARLPNLEVLWLNDNLLSKLQGLDHNFRLKHLYLHNNSITTLCNASCCITKLRHLETLQLQGNQLQDLKATLNVLSHLHYLRKLGLSRNPLALEGSYREATIFAIPSLQFLDSSVVTPMERQAAVKFFTAKRIEKKYAFGTIPKIWDKPDFIHIGDPSVGELQLRKEIQVATRRRAIASAEKKALEEQEASRPRFEVQYARDATELLSAQMGASTVASKAFEFVARGRVPHLLVKLGFLRLTSAGRHTAALLGELGQGNGSQATVHVSVSCMGVLSAHGKTLQSRDVVTAQLNNDEEAAFLRFEEFLFDPSIYAAAYDKVQQLKHMGREDEITVGVTLRETSTGQPIGVARLPLMPLFQEHVEKEYKFDETPLVAPQRASAAGLAPGTPVGSLSLSLTTDWGLSNTCAGEYGNSAFEFVRTRREKHRQDTPDTASAGSGSRSAGAAQKPPGAASSVMSSSGLAPKRLARDTVVLKSLPPPKGPSGGAAPPPSAAGFYFDAQLYAKYEKQKATKLLSRGSGRGTNASNETVIPL